MKALATLASLGRFGVGALPTRARLTHTYEPRRLAAGDLATAVAAVHGPGARLRAVQVEPDSSGTTDRFRVRLTWADDVTEVAQLPRTLFAKGTPARPASRAIVSGFGLSEAETRFYREIQPEAAAITLQPYLIRLGRAGHHLLVLEDLADSGATFHAAGHASDLGFAESLIDQLARLHGRFWDSDRFAGDLSWVVPQAERPGAAIMGAAFTWSAKRAVQGGSGTESELTDGVRSATRLYDENRPALMRVWAAQTPTVCHGDTHVGNTFQRADGSAGLYDWQVLHRACGLRDVAYFLCHSVPTELRREHQEALLRRYLAGVTESGARRVPSFDEAFDLYRLLAFDGWVAVLFTAAAGGLQDADKVAVSRRRAVATLTDLDTHGALRDALAGRYGGAP